MKESSKTRVSYPPLPSRSRGRDPLVTHRTVHLGFGLLLLLGALLSHVALAFSLVGISSWTSSDKTVTSTNVPIEVAIVEPPPEPEPLIETPEPAVPEPVLPLPPKPKPKKIVETPADPIDIPDVPDTAPTPQKTQKIVGLNFGSTVEGSGGPSFAVGNTRMGTTRKKAQDPTVVKKLPSSPNRVAANIPTKGVTLVRPKRKSKRKPPYPDLYKEQQLEGQVVVEVLVSEKGTVASARILSPSPHKEFNKVALATAKKELFAPATKNGIAIPYRISFTYRFRFSDN